MSEMNTNGYYENQDNSQFDNQHNKKHKNKGLIAVIIAAVAFVVILSCVAGIIVLLRGDSTEIGKIPSTTESQTEGQYEDIGSTDATQNSSGGSVIVTDVSKVVENTMPSVVAITSLSLIHISALLMR